MLRLLLSRAQECKNLRKTSKPCHIGIHLKALPENSQIENQCARVSVILSDFLHHFQLAKLATSSIRVKCVFSNNFVISTRISEKYITSHPSPGSDSDGF